MIDKQTLNCEIIDLSYDGRGIGRINGKTCFIDGALPTEKVAFRLYLDLADQVENEDQKALFLSLAQEEAKHKLRFEIEYDDVVLNQN